MIFHKPILTACFLAAGFLPTVIHAAAVESITIEDVGSGDTGAFSPVLDIFSGAFRFSPIDDTTYLGAKLFTTDVAPIDVFSAQAAGDFSTGFIFAGQPFIPKTLGPIVADISVVAGVPELSITSLPFAGDFGDPGFVTVFVLGPQASDPGECDAATNHIPLTVQWLERIGVTDDYRYKIKWTHCITAAEDLSEAFVSFRANWRLEGVMSVTPSVPVVTGISPVDTGTNVPTNAKISVAFNEAMDAATITGGGMSVNPGNICAGNITTADNKVFVCDPGALNSSAAYTVTLSTAITDASGTAIGSEVSSGFTTGTNLDSIVPTIASIAPADNATDINTANAITVTFADDVLAGDSLGTMGAQTLNAISLKQGGTPIDGVTTTSDNLSFVFTPFSPLAFNTLYTVTVTASSAIDSASNQLAADLVTSFTTGTATTLADAVTGTKVSIDGAGGASLVSLEILTAGQVGGTPPDRVVFDEEFITYTINGVITQSIVTIDFPQSLTGKTIYKVINGTFTALVDGTDYQLLDDDTITITIVDNGPFDSDPVTGIITDPIVAGTDLGPRPVPGSLSSASWLLLLIAPLLFSIRRYANKK